MIVPASPAELATMSDEQVVAAYEGIGFDHETALAYTSVLRKSRVEKTELPTSHFMTIGEAAVIAKAAGHAGLLREVAASEKAGVGFIKVGEADDGSVSVGAPKGVAVMFMLDADTPELQKAATERSPHITVAYLGAAADLSLKQTRAVISVAKDVAARHSGLRGVVKGTGYFADSGAWYGQVHVPGLADLREDLVKSLKAADLPVDETHDFTPHVTLAYSETEPDDDMEPFEVELGTLTTGVGSFRYDAKLAAEAEGIDTEDGLPIAKADSERRFTMSPMYVPGRYDAHLDWATPDDLQEAVWKFSRGDRLIARQHRPQDGSVGEVVEMMVVPFEHTWPITKADGTVEDHTFPAGTPWCGIIWTPEAFEEIKKGKMRGLSIGGRANLLNVRMEDDPS